MQISNHSIRNYANTWLNKSIVVEKGFSLGYAYSFAWFSAIPTATAKQKHACKLIASTQIMPVHFVHYQPFQPFCSVNQNHAFI